MALLIRPALPEEAPALGSLVRGAAGDLPEVTPEYLEHSAVFSGWEGSRLAGFFALEERGGSWWLSHLWVAEASAGRGRGRWLLGDAVRRARRMGADRLNLAPIPEARTFFERLGAQPAGQGAARLQIDVATWLEPLPESMSELGAPE